MDEAFIKALGIAAGTVDALRADVRKNLEREVKFRVLGRNKGAAMDALVKLAELDVPKSLVAAEVDRMIDGARDDLKQRGVKDADKAPIPAEIFQAQAERRVRLGLVVGELVRQQNLQAKPEQLQSHIEELSQSYEKPAEVMRWYLSRPQAHGRGRGGGGRVQRDAVRAESREGGRQGAGVHRIDGDLKHEQ